MLAIWSICTLFYKEKNKTTVTNLKRRVISIFIVLLGTLIGWMWGVFWGIGGIPYQYYNTNYAYIEYIISVSISVMLSGILGYTIKLYGLKKVFRKINFLLILILFLVGIPIINMYLSSFLFP
jgi:hypothetical protein